MPLQESPDHPDQAPTHLNNLINRFRPDLTPFEETYRHIHAHPELSAQEEQTAQLASTHLQSLNYEVHTHIGGHGVAGILHNGTGPAVLLRADMDALPVEEKTGLPYASTRFVQDEDGARTPVMHACGHDTHVTSLLAVSTLLHAAREHWRGTLIVVFQPSEEHLNGAQAMLHDGFYEKVPRPDIVLAQHVMRMRAGTVNIQPGPLLTAADAFDIRIFGRGGHGSAPQTTIDPILIGAAVVMRLQGIVSREVAPGEVAVVSCGSIQGGNSANTIPDYLDLQLSVRTLEDGVREKKPRIIRTVSSPATVNDEVSVGRLGDVFREYFRDALVGMESPSASEDFSLLATAVGAPYVMWMFGGVEEETWDEAVAKGTVNELPSNHSPYFAPVIQPTLRTGVDAMALGALTFLGRK
ncbi:uncharacterized protein N7458_002054 [Penicillium daleae]|uniref:Peptidase M20 dimerisation domain-containing protein n=1 Tax=Penicillium daleae TaxID=63821 RepID=A0AAD6CEF3_9EURO|nr:uncharacterized protein N7458_002054 [Penicillium daleae]KAJ5460502.1 hypothetical protein N7458_002054 [Penicillium daleae]